MKSVYKTLLFSGLMISMISCARYEEKKTTSPENNKNNQEKLSTFGTSLEAVARIEAAVVLLHEGTPAINDDLVQEIKAKLDIPQCVISYDKSTATQGDRKSILKIAGESCAFAADYIVAFTVKNANLITIDVVGSFLIKDPLILEKNEIYKMNIRGTGSVKSSDTKIITNVSYTGNLFVNGKDTMSLVYEHIDSKSAVNPQYQANGTTLLALNFPQEKKTVDGKETITASYRIDLKKSKLISVSKDLSTYTLNSSSLDQEAYDKYLSYLGLLSVGN